MALREQIQSAEAQAAAVSGVQTLVEFSNSTGTTRTPIVIDVSAAGFEFLPNSVRVTMADMEKFPVRDNPLLSGILAVHQHRSGRSLTAEPYVLLLVRPGGSLPFYGAQRILTGARWLSEVEGEVGGLHPDARERWRRLAADLSPRSKEP